MPNIESAKKRLRQSNKRRLRNQIRKTRCKSSRKEFLAALAREDVEAADKAFNSCVSIFDKAAKTRAVSRAKADRNKANLMRKLTALKNKLPSAAE